MATPLKYRPPNLVISWQDETDRPAAQELASRLELPLAPDRPQSGLHLHLNQGRLELRHEGKGRTGPVYVDFSEGKAAYRRLHGGGRNQPLARAVGLKKNRCPLVLDATAGLGRDAFVLASLGCQVMMVERSAILHALLADGLRRGAEDPHIAAIITRMELTLGNALQVKQLAKTPDVVYLDPMYPHRSKSSLVKKEMRITRVVVGDDPDADDLLAWAMTLGAGRVVVKRPKGAPFLGNKKPQLILKSKNSRFDVYFPPFNKRHKEELNNDI